MIVAAAVVIAACGGGDGGETRPLTVDEYLIFCGDSEDTTLLAAHPEVRETVEAINEAEIEDVETWGEFRDLFQDILPQVRKIQPPPDLVRYHRAMLLAVNTLIEFAAQQPKDDLYNPFALLVPGLVAAGIVEQAAQALPEGLRVRLEDAGCETTVQ